MINGLGVLGWGVGGIEAEAAMLGQPVSMLVPQVVGFRLTGKLREGATATDLVLTVTEMLRKLGVVGKFVEFYGPGISELPLADRATIANMAPEYGATCGIFPVDAETLKYLRLTGRSEEQIALAEAYYKAQGLFHTPDAPEAEYSAHAVAGPEHGRAERGGTEAAAGSRAAVARRRRASRRAAELQGPNANKSEVRQMVRWEGEGGHTSADGNLASSVGSPAPEIPVSVTVTATSHEKPAGGKQEDVAMEHTVRARFGVDPDKYLSNGSIVIAAITSCTNTSNPYVMVAAGLLAKKAVEAGLSTPPWVKTSLAPGSRVVTDYYTRAGLLPYLDKLRFQVVGYGCTTCIGNSGPLPEDVSKAIEEHGLVAVSVLCGNRNFEGRISPEVRANYLMSPPLVVAYALAGHIEHDFETDPLGKGKNGKPVYLRDIWPTQKEVSDTVAACIDSEMFRTQYCTVTDGDANWQNLKFPSGDTYGWEQDSTYIRKAPYFDGMPATPAAVEDIRAARVLAVLGDSVTTDHISPAGSIKQNGPAGKYLTEHGVKPFDFNSYGSRRGNHEVMVRGTFANVRLRNKLAPGTEGGVTRLLPEGTGMSIYDAALSTRSAVRRSASSPARSTAQAPRATGRRKARACWAFGSSSPRATSASTARTSSAWASCPSSTSRARAPSPWASPAKRPSIGDHPGTQGHARLQICRTASTSPSSRRPTRQDNINFRAPSASTHRRRSSTTSTEASCSTSSASWRARRSRGPLPQKTEAGTQSNAQHDRAGGVLQPKYHRATPECPHPEQLSTFDS